MIRLTLFLIFVCVHASVCVLYTRLYAAGGGMLGAEVRGQLSIVSSLSCESQEPDLGP